MSADLKLRRLLVILCIKFEVTPLELQEMTALIDEIDDKLPQSVERNRP